MKNSRIFTCELHCRMLLVSEGSPAQVLASANLRKHYFRHLKNYELNPRLMHGFYYSCGVCSLHFSPLLSQYCLSNASMSSGVRMEGTIPVRVYVRNSNFQILKQLFWKSQFTCKFKILISKYYFENHTYQLLKFKILMLKCVFALFRHHFQMIIPNH